MSHESRDDDRLRIVDTPVLDIAQLDASDRIALGDQLYATHSNIFDGVDRRAFQRYVVDSGARRTVIQRYICETGRVVGYAALHVFERELLGEPIVVLRGEAGLEKPYRGRSSPGRFVAGETLRMLLGNMGRRTFILSCPVHPVSYYAVSRLVPEIWPHHDRVMTPGTFALLMELADAFGLPTVDPSRPLVRHVGWRTRETEAERAFWHRHSDPRVQYYLNMNPGYRDGMGMLMLVPLSVGKLISALATLGAQQVRRSLARRRGRRAATMSGADA